VAPSIEYPVKDGETFNVPQDDNITICCSATGYPAPSLRWIRQGAELDDRRFFIVEEEEEYSVKTNITRVTFSLVITNASRDDIDQYICIAKNFLDDNVTRTINVFVQCTYVENDIIVP